MRASVSGVSSVSALKIRIFVSANRKQKTRSGRLQCAADKKCLSTKSCQQQTYTNSASYYQSYNASYCENFCAAEKCHDQALKQAAEGAGGCCCDRSRDGRVPMIPGN